MAKISGTIPNFANGVSQQAMALRLSSQGDLQVNAYSTVVDGLRKRPPTQQIANLGDISGTLGTGDAVYKHTIDRDSQERYQVFISDQGIRVFDLESGVERTVNTPDGINYLGHTSARAPYRALTVGDYTFIANPQQTVQMDPTVIEPLSPSEAIIHILAGNYGKTYKITIDGLVFAQYQTPDGTSAAQSPAVSTDAIARRLATGYTPPLDETINGHPNGNWTWKLEDTNLEYQGFTAANGWTIKVTKGTIYIRKDDGTPFSIGVEDGYNGHAAKAIMKEVQDFSDLPGFCEVGMAVKVTGSVATKYDDYYVRFDKPNKQAGDGSPGVWREIPGPGTKKALDAATMPHVLVREADGSFTFKKAAWSERKAGDQEITPGPSFIGRKINDVVFFKNRVGFLAGENVVMSRAGAFFDFWRATATALLDDDPIDVAAAENGVSVLRYAVPFNDRLVLFADQAQFTLKGDQLLTPKTVSMTLSTSYQMSLLARPEAAGDVLYFPTKRGQFSMVREFRINEDTGSAKADDVTGHVPQFIPGTIEKIKASTHEDIMVVKADGRAASLWVYKYYWSEREKLQASWSEWTFPQVDDILDFTFIQSRLHMVVQRDGQTYLEAMEVQPGGTDINSPFICHLDRRWKEEPSGDWAYDHLLDETTIPTGVNLTNTVYTCVTTGGPGAALKPGLEFPIVSATDTHVTIKGDVRGTPLYFGIPYEMRYRLSTIYLREEGRGGAVNVVTEGRLQLLQLRFLFSKTAYFAVEVTPLSGQTREYFTNGRLMGDPDNVTDEVVLSDGTLRIPILSKNDRLKVEIVNDSYLPCSILSAEWSANYVKKSQRI